MNEYPILAAGNPYAGKNSRLERSWRARQQLRDSKGRWIYMGGNLGIKLKLSNGENIRAYGKNVGPSESNPGYAQVYIENSGTPEIPDGFYLAKGDKGRIYKAVLTKEQLKEQGIDLQDVSNTDPELQQIADLIPIDAPEGWTKKDDGSYETADGDYTIAKAEDGKWELQQDGIPVADYENPGDAFADAADRDAEELLSEPEKTKVAELRSQQDKLNDEFSKTENPEAMARIEKKLEVIDGGIKDIIRNKPAEDVAPEAEKKAEAQAPTPSPETQKILDAAEDYKASFEDYQDIPADQFKVGDDTNHAFINESPVGTEIKFTREFTDAYDESYDAEITFTKVGPDQWDAVGHDAYEGYKWSNKELQNENDYYQITKIGEEKKLSDREIRQEMQKNADIESFEKKPRNMSDEDIAAEIAEIEKNDAFKYAKEFPNTPAAQNNPMVLRHAELVGEQFNRKPLAERQKAYDVIAKVLDDYKLVEGAKGSNKGGVYEGPDGDKVYVKFQDEEHANNEVLASKLYDLAGVPAAEVNKGTLNGESVTYSPMIEDTGSLADNLENPEFMQALQDGFAVDAWLANWDVAGLNYDNVLADEFGMPFRVDPGGALQYRAQGAPKGDKFGSDVTEVDSLVDPKSNKQSADVFGSMTDEQKAESAKLVQAVTDAQIDDAVESVYGTTPEGAALAQKLKDRRDSVIARLQPTEIAPAVDEKSKIANTPLGEDINTWEADLKSAMDSLSGAEEVAPTGNTPMPESNSYLDWEDWAFNAEVGTTVYSHIDGQGTYSWTRTEDGWTVTNIESGDEVFVSPSGVVAQQGAAGKFVNTPEELPDVPEVAIEDVATSEKPVNVITTGAGTRVKSVENGDNYGVLQPTVNNSIDAIFTPEDGNDLKANFPNMEDAQIWLGDLIAGQIGSDTNVFTLKPVGEKDLKPVVHKGGNLNAASPAQISKVKNLLAGKDIDENRKQEIQNILGKDGLASGEIGMIIGELSKLPDSPNPQTKPKEDAPAVEAVDNPQINPQTFSDELDPNLIMQQVLESNPNAQKISDSDILIVSSTYTKAASGKSYKYDLIVRRTKKERFFAYVRETDMQTGQVRFSKVTKEVHSYEALANKLGSAKYQITSGPDARLWFQKRTNIEVSQNPEGLYANEFVDFIEGTNVPKSQDEAYNDLAKLINHLAESDAASKAVIEALADAKGIDPEVANEIYDIIVGNAVAKMGHTPDGSVPEAPHVSYDGVTQVKVGDYVDWTDNNPNSSTYGQVFRGTVSKLRYSENSKGYKYSDKVYAVFPEYNAIHGYPSSRQRSRVTSGLIVVDKNAPKSAPFVPKVKEAKEQEKVTGGFFDVPSGDGPAPAKPKVSAPAKPADVKYDTNGTSYVDTPAGPVEVPSSSQSVAEIIPTGTDITIKPNQISVNDYIPVIPDDVKNPTMGKVTTVSKEADGTVTIAYVYVNDAKETKKKDLVFGPSTAQNANMVVKRPGEVPEIVTADKAPADWKSMPASAIQKSSIANQAAEKNLPSVLDVQIDKFLNSPDSTIADAIEILDALDKINNSNEPAPTPSMEQVGETLASLKEALKNVDDAATSVSDTMDKMVKAETDGYEGYPVKRIAAKDIVFAKAKKNAPFTNVAKMKLEDLQIGDIIPAKTYKYGKFFKQVLSVENTQGNQYEVVIRYISDDPSFDGKVETVTMYDTYYGALKHVKTPTASIWPDYIAEGYSGNPLSGDPLSVEADPNIKPVENFDALSAESIAQWTPEFYDAVGLPNELDGAPYSTISNYSQMQTFAYIFQKNNAFINANNSHGPSHMIPGSVVRSADKGSSGIVTDVNGSTVNVSWLSGAKAGNVEVLGGQKVIPVAKWVSPEKAKEYGVNVNTEPLESAKTAFAAEAEKIKAANVEKILKEAQIAEWNKKKASATVSGTGADPVEAPENLSWDHKVANNVDSVESALDKVNSGQAATQFGLNALVDSGEIEDNKVRLTKVVGTDGKTYTRVEFTATSWAADKQTDGSDGLVGIAANADGTVKSNGIQFPKFEMQADGTLKQVGVWSNGKIDYSKEGSTYRVPIVAPDGTEIGYYLFHRGNKNDSTLDFSENASGSSPKSYHNKVDIYLDNDVSTETLQYALSKVGIKASRPATAEDIRVTAENKLIDLLGNKKNGAVNYAEPLRSEILAGIKERYGVDASDISIVQDGSDIFYLLPEEFGKKMAEKTTTDSFIHSWTSTNLPDAGEARAQFLFDILTKTGLRPTTARRAHGINSDGMSSDSDGYHHGAGYIYTGKNKSLGSVGFVFDAAKMLRRLDLYANQYDKFGQKIDETPIEDILSKNKVYEILFKDTISWADLSTLKVDSATRAILLEKLLNAGVKNFGDRTVEQVLGVSN